MTSAEFFRKDGEVVGFKVKGHSGYGEEGEDIVCASVSSAVMLTANLITEIFGYKADVSAVGDTVSLKTDIKGGETLQKGGETLQKLYQGLIMQLEQVALQYKENLTIKFSEV